MKPGPDRGERSLIEALDEEERLWVALADGRRLGVLLAWFPRLMRASAEAREGVEISAFGLHRAALDVDISVAGLLARRGDRRSAERTTGAPTLLVAEHREQRDVRPVVPQY